MTPVSRTIDEHFNYYINGVVNILSRNYLYKHVTSIFVSNFIVDISFFSSVFFITMTVVVAAAAAAVASPPAAAIALIVNIAIRSIEIVL